MGLDQVIYAAEIGDLVEEDGHKTVRSEHLYSFRKVPMLHGFMEYKWAERGFKVINLTTGETEKSEDRVFNCVPLEITENLLSELKEAVENKTLPEKTNGFFFGRHYDEDYTDIANMIYEVEDVVKEGRTVWYDSWW